MILLWQTLFPVRPLSDRPSRSVEIHWTWNPKRCHSRCDASRSDTATLWSDTSSNRLNKQQSGEQELVNIPASFDIKRWLGVNQQQPKTPLLTSESPWWGLRRDGLKLICRQCQRWGRGRRCVQLSPRYSDVPSLCLYRHIQARCLTGGFGLTFGGSDAQRQVDTGLKEGQDSERSWRRVCVHTVPKSYRLLYDHLIAFPAGGLMSRQQNHVYMCLFVR